MSELTKIELLKKLYEGREDIMPSIPELAQYTGKSVGTVHEELQELVNIEFVKPPPKPHMTRAYRITPKGIQYLAQNGYIGPRYATPEEIWSK